MTTITLVRATRVERALGEVFTSMIGNLCFLGREEHWPMRSLKIQMMKFDFQVCLNVPAL